MLTRHRLLQPLVRISVDHGPHQGSKMFQITIGSLTITQCTILPNHLLRESLTRKLMMSLYDKRVRKVGPPISKTRPSDGKLKMKICKRSVSVQPWHRPLDNRAFVRVGLKHQFLTAITPQHHRQRLITTYSPYTNQQQPTRPISNTPIKINRPDLAITRKWPSIKMEEFLSQKPLTLHRQITRLLSPLNLPNQPNHLPSTSTAKTSTSTKSPRKAKTNQIPTPALNPNPPTSPNGLSLPNFARSS